MAAMKTNEAFICQTLFKPGQHFCYHHRFSIIEKQFAIIADSFYTNYRGTIDCLGSPACMQKQDADRRVTLVR